MKATGMIRRIDDLGRIVIPIEIRRQMKIRDGDPLEIYVDEDGEVILKKYSVIADLGRFSEEIVASLHQTTGCSVMMSDRDSIVAVAGDDGRGYLDRPIGELVFHTMDERSTLFSETGETKSPLFEGSEESFGPVIIAPIIAAGDPIGSIIVVDPDQKNGLSDVEVKLAETAAGFLARHMEE